MVNLDKLICKIIEKSENCVITNISIQLAEILKEFLAEEGMEYRNGQIVFSIKYKVGDKLRRTVCASADIVITIVKIDETYYYFDNGDKCPIQFIDNHWEPVN